MAIPRPDPCSSPAHRPFQYLHCRFQHRRRRADDTGAANAVPTTGVAAAHIAKKAATDASSVLGCAAVTDLPAAANDAAFPTKAAAAHPASGATADAPTATTGATVAALTVAGVTTAAAAAIFARHCCLRSNEIGY